ncbi:hypothetical protein [Chryseobacterium arthrosphaerae]|uniref:hypothetical protein n=1 Tax=Chryseobacterium arthrosphaerae TaxID=651561 RepID=UPI00241D0F72|nr:hypothetical protein [Chryseobacterium arthrosphaerae]
MNKKISDFALKVEELRDKAFTDELKKNELGITKIFNELKVKVDRLNIYDNGGILSIAVNLDEHNKKVLSECIKDFDVYNELIDLQYASEKKGSQTDLISIIDFIESKTSDSIHYDIEKEVFYYY